MISRIYFQAPGEPRRPSGVDAVVSLEGPGAAGFPLHHNLSRHLPPPQESAPDVFSFLFAALGVWAADKLLPRSVAPDAWTRSIELHLPLSPAWIPLAPRLASLLDFLTGDNWVLKVRSLADGLSLGGPWPHRWQPQEVMLFSGGLDSLAGALDRLEAGGRVLLVSHYDFGQLASLQQGLARSLARHYGEERVRHLGLRVQFPEAPELTLRSRSILYLALGLAAAAACEGAPPVIVPENGWVSLNVPLTPSRLGSYSTRTTHPYFLEGLCGLWREAGLGHSLTNAYQGLSKGRVLEGCRNRELLRTLCRQTVSCARPVVSRWQGRGMVSCGYCYPCLLRRAALHRLGWDEGTDYGLDVLSTEGNLRHRVRGRDLRALLLALKTWEEHPREVEARLWLGSAAVDIPARYRQARGVLEEGFREIAQFCRDKGPEWIKAYGGW